MFDIEIDTDDPDQFIRTVKLLEPTFGGINLEDIKAPECFVIEQALSQQMSIPVFHDDQHGTAIISGAALINAAELAGKRLEDLRVVINGAGAAGIASAKMYLRLGGAVAIGPLLMGLSKPFNVLQRGSDMETVVNVAAVTVVQAQEQTT